MPAERIPLAASFGTVWQDGAPARGLPRVAWKTNTRRLASPRIPWQDGQHTAPATRAVWRIHPQVTTAGNRIMYTPAAPVSDARRIPWFYVVALQQSARIPWRKTAPENGFVQRTISAPWHGVFPGILTARAPWNEAQKVAQNVRIPYISGRPHLYVQTCRIPWRDAWRWPRPGHWSSPPVPYIPDPPYPPTPPDPPWPPGGLIIPVREVYIVIHQANLYRVDTGAPIHAESLSIQLDADSWAWQFSARILGADSLAAIEPNANGDPVIIEAELNGHRWRFVLDGWREDREFGRHTASIQGRGLTALLAAPWRLPTDGVADADLTLRQIVESHLPTEITWTAHWHPAAPDWLVPAGAWQWQDKTPIAAIHDAVQGVGMIVHPAPAAHAFTIQPRYPVLPWHFATAAPDLVIPDAAILHAERAQAAPTQANAVFVHGEEIGGMIGLVVREGSAGDRFAATQQSTLLTQAEALRLLGSRILAGQHEQPTLRSLTTTLGDDFPLAQIGWLLRAEIDGAAHHGIINAVRIEADASRGNQTIRQTLTLGEETPNLWSKFHTLTPETDPQMLATIERQHPDGTATVRLLNGGARRLPNPENHPTGTPVYIQKNTIQKPAPNLPQHSIET